MENLGNVNILFNKYKIGETLPTNKQISFIGMIQDWIYIKDNVMGIEDKRTSETKYIFTLNIIDLEILQQIFYSLIRIYKEKYPYSKKEDFLIDVLGTTFTDLFELVENKYPLEDYFYKVTNYQSKAYFKYDYIENELIDFIVDDDKDYKYYIQYANKVLELIDDLDFDNSINSKDKTEDITIESLNFKLNDIENNFDNVKIIDVYNHFKIHLVEKKYITEIELLKYLKFAFDLKSKPNEKFKLSKFKTVKEINCVFYTYYKEIAQKPHGKQNKYIELLSEYFDGFEIKSLRTNFAKSCY